MTGINITGICTHRWKKPAWVQKPRCGAQSNGKFKLEEMEFQFCKGLEPHRPVQLPRAPSLLPVPCWLQGSAAAPPAGGERGMPGWQGWVRLEPWAAHCLWGHLQPSCAGTWPLGILRYPGDSAQQDEYISGNGGRALRPLWFLITLVKSLGIAIIKFGVSE